MTDPLRPPSLRPAGSPGQRRLFVVVSIIILAAILWFVIVPLGRSIFSAGQHSVQPTG